MAQRKMAIVEFLLFAAKTNVILNISVLSECSSYSPREINSFNTISVLFLHGGSLADKLMKFFLHAAT